jgi:serine/threonine-protein kinase
MVPSIPPTLGEYTLLAKLASGGMASVYVGRKSGVAGFERLVAIKLCHPHLREDREFSSMFLDEARLAARIRHPNVVGTLDVSEGEFLYLVMEYIEGFTLSHLVKHAKQRQARVPPGVAARVMIDTLLGLHAAHELKDADGALIGLVHRDVSPQNVLVGVDGVSRITDFGIAFASARSTVTQDGRIKGKFAYLSPEQATSSHVSRRMDIFSAGTVLWEALTGRALFRRQEDAATLHAVLTAPVPAASSLVPGLPPTVDRVLLKALRKRPEDRYETARDFAEALEGLALEGMSARLVGEYVEREFAPALEERRALIRQAPEAIARHTPSQITRSLLPSALEADTDPTGVSPGTLWERVSRDLLEGHASPPAAAEIEHRRMRGLLAAVMLLLVGGALGLILARSHDGPKDAAPPSAPNAPLRGPSR